MESILGNVAMIGRGIGLFFGLGFVAIVVIWAQYLVRWRDEKRDLGLADGTLTWLLRELEQPRGTLYASLKDRVDGLPCRAFPAQEQFEDWFARHVSRAGGVRRGGVVRRYVWGVLSSARPRLRPTDNRVSLTVVRNDLKHYRYHRWLNLGLANTAVSLGVLGTVSGLWAGLGKVDFSSGEVASVMGEVMQAMSQALYTTGLGVLISIPIIISSLHMERQLERIFGAVAEVHNAIVATLREIEAQEREHAA